MVLHRPVETARLCGKFTELSQNPVFRSSHWKFLILGLHEVDRVTSTK
jgi:hypothetical protein